MDPTLGAVEAVGFAKGHVTAAGSLEQVRADTPGAEERELSGAVVYPGFIDAHHHLCFAATYANIPELHTPPYRNIAQILKAVSDHAARAQPGEWLVFFGYNELRLDDHRKPSREELDKAAPGNPVLLIHHSYHEGVLNTAGLELSGLSELKADPIGGSIVRTRLGAPTGVVTERCFGQAEGVARQACLAKSRDGWFSAAGAYQERLLAAGITHVCDAAVPPSLERLYVEWDRRGELLIGVTMMPIVENMMGAPHDRLRANATGWQEGRLNVGTMLYPDDSIFDMIKAAANSGFSVGVHAGGNAAIAKVLEAMAAHHAGPLPPRIDHFFFADHENRQRAADIGAHIVVQPPHLGDFGQVVLSAGLPKTLGFHAYRDHLDAGLTLAASSDAPVSTFDVRRAIQTAVTRRLPSGARLMPEQAVTAKEVLKMYTTGGAAVLGMHGQIGVLAPGARADAVVFSEDLTTVPAERLMEVGVKATVIGRKEFRF
jgi:predicted amidohydrolase YtcJ